MEYEIKTIVCPNCGANTTNHQNCEYCGSMLVRCYEMMDIDEDSDEEDIKGVLKLFGKSAYTNNFLCERVKKIIYLSEKHQTEIIGDFYAYNYAEMGRYSTVSDTDADADEDEDEDEEMDTCISWHNVLTVKSNPQSNTLTLVVKFNMQRKYQNSCFVNFEDRTFCKFFNLEQDDSIMLCSMEIDKNEITAAKFIKYIIEELFYWKDNKYECRIFGIINGEATDFVPKHLVDSHQYKKAYKNNIIIMWLLIVLSIPYFILIGHVGLEVEFEFDVEFGTYGILIGGTILYLALFIYILRRVFILGSKGTNETLGYKYYDGLLSEE